MLLKHTAVSSKKGLYPSSVGFFFFFFLIHLPRVAAFKPLHKGSYRVTSAVPVTLCTYPEKQYYLALIWVADLE